MSEPLFPTLGVREKRLGSRVTSIGMGCEVNGGPVMSSNFWSAFDSPAGPEYPEPRDIRDSEAWETTPVALEHMSLAAFFFCFWFSLSPHSWHHDAISVLLMLADLTPIMRPASKLMSASSRSFPLKTYSQMVVPLHIPLLRFSFPPWSPALAKQWKRITFQ